MDIAHRQVVIGVRNPRPDQIGLAGQHVGKVHFAVYGTGSICARVVGTTPSAAWVADQDGTAIEVTYPTLALDLAQAGAAQAVLPTFIGDRIAGVDRSGCIDRLVGLLKPLCRRSPKIRPARPCHTVPARGRYRLR